LNCWVDKSCLEHRLTDDEKKLFENQGYLIIKHVLTESHVEIFLDIVKRIEQKTENKKLLAYYRHFILEDEAFIDLLTHPQTFPKVFDILGWNIYCYHNHMNISVPSNCPVPSKETFGWHKDGGRINEDIPIASKPLSVKVAFFLSDTSEPHMGNFTVIPESQMDKDPNPVNVKKICVNKGDVVIFDNRLWHSGSINCSEITRRVLFYGYAYRWQRPQDEFSLSFIDKFENPIIKQLLGHCSGGKGYYQPLPEDMPLHLWLKKCADIEKTV